VRLMQPRARSIEGQPRTARGGGLVPQGGRVMVTTVDGNLSFADWLKKQRAAGFYQPGADLSDEETRLPVNRLAGRDRLTGMPRTVKPVPAGGSLVNTVRINPVDLPVIPKTVTPRHSNDLYRTPQSAIDPLIADLKANSALRYMRGAGAVVLDPGCGDGRLGLAAARAFDMKGLFVDIVPTIGGGSLSNVSLAVPQGAAVYAGDFLDLKPGTVPLGKSQVGGGSAFGWETPSLIICNPPYSKAQEFIDQAFKWQRTDHTTITAVLLRLNFLGSQKRKDWWQHQYETPRIRILSHRPSFEGTKGTDSTEYAWFIWGPLGDNDSADMIDWY
jgi:predicted RNA methylase